MRKKKRTRVTEKDGYLYGQTDGHTEIQRDRQLEGLTEEKSLD